jgi:hypothetical protein
MAAASVMQTPTLFLPLEMSMAPPDKYRGAVIEVSPVWIVIYLMFTDCSVNRYMPGFATSSSILTSS